MPFDYKKEYKEFYLPENEPAIIEVPEMSFVAVRGEGNPNEEAGEYKTALSILYAVAFSVKMSYKTDERIEGYFEYVVPPLEGFWWQDGIAGVDYEHKESYRWISLIRLPEFVTENVFGNVVKAAEKKKKIDLSKAEYFTYKEGLCVQCMHSGSYDNEPATVALMEKYAAENGYITDINEQRFHHEIYLSDARRCAPDKLRTVIRHPVKIISIIKE